MSFKKYWFGQSLVWIGVLYNSPKPAIAQIVPLPASNSVPQETEQPSSPVVDRAGGISLPEVMPSIERLKQNPPNPNLAASNPLSSDTSASNSLENPLVIEEQNTPAAPTENSISPPTSVPNLSAPADSEFGGDESLNQIDQTRQETDPSEAIDPELGRLRLRETDGAIDSENEAAPIANSQDSLGESSDPELGTLRLQERDLAIEQDVDTVFLAAGVDYFRSDNILLDDIDPVNDQFVRAGISLLAIPSLGPQTQLLASVGGNLAFYGDLSELNYRNLEFRAEVQQTLFPNTYATIGWSNRQFSAADGDRFLNDHSVRFALSRRDFLDPQLTLDSFYQLRFSFADPSDRSRLINTFGTSLNYALERNLELGLNYQLDLTDFTEQEREDAYHQVTAQLSYDLSSSSRVSLYAGFSFGRSSNSQIDFDSSIVGITFDWFLPLF